MVAEVTPLVFKVSIISRALQISTTLHFANNKLKHENEITVGEERLIRAP